MLDMNDTKTHIMVCKGQQQNNDCPEWMAAGCFGRYTVEKWNVHIINIKLKMLTTLF